DRSAFTRPSSDSVCPLRPPVAVAVAVNSGLIVSIVVSSERDSVRRATLSSYGLPHRRSEEARGSTSAPANGPFPGGGRRLRRLLRPEPAHPPLQAPRRRHAGAVPQVRKNRLKAASPSKKPESAPLTIPHDQRVGAPVEPSAVGRSIGCATPLARAD